MFSTLLVSCFLVTTLSNLTYANVSGTMEFLEDKKWWTTFTQDMAQYTGASCIYIVTDSTESFGSNISKLHIGNAKSIWFRFLSSNNSTYIKDSIMSDLKWSILVIFKCEKKIASSVLKEVMDDTNTLNRISWVMEYAEADKWFYNIKQEIIFSPSIRLFVISILHYQKFNRNVTVVIIKYAYSDHENKIAKTATMGYWQPKRGLTQIVPFSRCCYNLTGYPVKIIYIKGDEPFSQVEKIGNTFKIAGISGNVLKIVLTFLGIKIVNIEAEPNGTFGGLDQNNKPTGLFKYLVEKQADIGLCILAYTEDRKEAADLTVSVFEDHVIGLYKPTVNSKFWSFYVKPFSLSSWILILILIMFLMMFSVILMRYFLKARLINSNQYDILGICGLLLNQGSTQDHTSVGWRIYNWSVMLLGTLLVSFYGSKIVAENTVLHHEVFFNNFYEVANHPLYRPIVWKDAATYRILKNSADPEASEIWNRMKKDINHYTVTSTEQIIEHVECCQAVYIGPSSLIKYMKSKHPSFVILDHSLGNLPLGFPLQKNSPLTRIFNTVLNSLHEGGIIQHIKNDHLNFTSKIQKTKIVKQIVLAEMRFPVTFIASAILFTILLCFIEMIWVTS